MNDSDYSLYDFSYISRMNFWRHDDSFHVAFFTFFVDQNFPVLHVKKQINEKIKSEFYKNLIFCVLGINKTA